MKCGFKKFSIEAMLGVTEKSVWIDMGESGSQIWIKWGNPEWFSLRLLSMSEAGK